MQSKDWKVKCWPTLNTDILEAQAGEGRQRKQVHYATKVEQPLRATTCETAGLGGMSCYSPP
jgi:hypothetical protein